MLLTRMMKIMEFRFISIVLNQMCPKRDHQCTGSLGIYVEMEEFKRDKHVMLEENKIQDVKTVNYNHIIIVPI